MPPSVNHPAPASRTGLSRSPPLSPFLGGYVPPPYLAMMLRACRLTTSRGARDVSALSHATCRRSDNCSRSRQCANTPASSGSTRPVRTRARTTSRRQSMATAVRHALEHRIQRSSSSRAVAPCAEPAPAVFLARRGRKEARKSKHAPTSSGLWRWRIGTDGDRRRWTQAANDAMQRKAAGEFRPTGWASHG